MQNLKAIRYRQLSALMKAHGPITPNQLDAMLRQLCYAGLLKQDQEIICASGADPPGETHFEAIDVMLEITDGEIPVCVAEHAPLLLRFLSSGERSRAFFVISGQDPALYLPLSLLHG